MEYIKGHILEYILETLNNDEKENVINQSKCIFIKNNYKINKLITLLQMIKIYKICKINTNKKLKTKNI